MAHNPFLSMGEPIAPVTSDALNPFMIAETEQDMFSSDNPFVTNNPFSDFSAINEPPAGDTVPLDIFGTLDTTAEAKQYIDFQTDTNGPIDCFASLTKEIDNKLIKPTELDLSSTNVEMRSVYSSDEELQMPTRPPPPSRPLPPETQNLILSVTGQMDFTSTHLLDRIPPTRTPSPVSMRDIHSPSPTPELDGQSEDDLSQEQNVNPTPAESGIGADVFDINQNKPSRPMRPPARPQPPVPRPPPPRPPSHPPRPAQPQSRPDDINLFDAPVPTSVKPTKEAILSLYSAPKKEDQRKQIDFLSDDIISDVPESVAVPMEQSSSLTASTREPKSAVGEIAADLDFGTAATAELGLSFDTVMVDCSVPTDVACNVSAPIPPLSAERQSDTGEVSPPVSTYNGLFTCSTTLVGRGQNDVLKNPFEDTDLVVHAVGPNPAAFETDDRDVTNDVVEWGSTPEPMAQDGGAFPDSEDAFDAFSAKFDSTFSNRTNTVSAHAWGDAGAGVAEEVGSSGAEGFEAEAYDPFLSMGAPPPPAPAATPRLESQASHDSTDDTFSLFIRPKETGEWSGVEEEVPALAPPPRPHALPESPRVNPFDETPAPAPLAPHYEHRRTEPSHDESRRRSGGDSGGETPPTPLFDEDVSVPLEDFPRIKYVGPGWEMHLRQPNKKKITGQRFWKKVFVRLAYQGDNPVVQLLNSASDKEPFQELPLQACYSVSEVGAQQFDQFGKIFTVKLQYVFYKERPGVRPGQVTKAERITNKLSQFAAYAIQGDYQGVKEFGSDLRKLGLPVEHAPQVSQLFKLGSLCYEDVKQFSCSVEEALFRLPAHRDRALTYKMEEVQITAVDELYVEQDAEGSVLKQIARVRLFFLGFLSGMPDVELGVNDLRRQGREVVGRHDIIPVVTEEWIRVEEQEFHACVQPQEFNNTQIIKFKPPDACYIELMRFRVRPPKNRELPLQLKAVWCVTGNKVELRADALVPGFASRKLGQVPCEDVCIRFPIPECWIYLFRVEKHFRYGSVKSAHRRTGKIKGIERFLGAVDTLQESLIEVTSGQAKYEHQHRAIVWRMPRLPKEGQGAYTTHNLVCRMALTSYDQVPAELARWASVEFTMPATQVSHMTVRSVSLQEHDNDPPEKYVRYLARHEYKVGIERTSGQAPAAYSAVTAPPPGPPPGPPPAPIAPLAPPSSDSDSD